MLAGSVGLVVSWRRGALPPSWSFYAGLLFVGWGAFNLIEGIVNHHVLQIHHVRDDIGAPTGWDVGFLIVGAALIVGGWALYRAGLRSAGRR